MDHNTIYKGIHGERIIHRHLTMGFVITQRKRIEEGKGAFTMKESRDGKFFWRVDLEGPVDIDRSHDLPTGLVAVEMVVVRKRKELPGSI